MKKILLTVILALIPVIMATAQGLTPVTGGQATNIAGTSYDDEAEFEDEVYGTLTRRGGRLFLDGELLSRKDAKLVLGPQIFDDTYKGARRQCRTANTLCTAGVLGILGGAAAIILSELGRDDLFEDGDSFNLTMDDYDEIAAAGLMAIAGGAVLINLSIPFASIGKSRLAWVCDDYNSRSRNSGYTLNLGIQKHGYGLAFNF